MACVENHEVLDIIENALAGSKTCDVRHVKRESECVEFRDGDQWYEIVVRPIDEPSTETGD